MNTVENQVLLQWQAPMRPHPERGQRWYVIGGLLVVIVAAYGIMTGAWSVSIVSLLTGALYFLLRDHTPPLQTIGILQAGIGFGDSFTRWEDLDGFWILQTPDYNMLHIHKKQARAKDIVILTGNADLTQIRRTLSNFVPELTGKDESFLDALIRITKL